MKPWLSFFVFAIVCSAAASSQVLEREDDKTGQELAEVLTHEHDIQAYLRKECPLCGMDVEDDREVRFVGNQVINFCSMQHDVDFLEDPARFMEVTVIDEPDEATLRDHGQDMACPVCMMSVPSLTGPDNRINVGDNKDSKQYIHTCSAGCAETIVSDPHAFIDHDHDSGSDDDDDYCWGGLTMFHTGFTFDTDPCVVLLFEEWTLDSETKFWLGVVGSFLAGMLHEAFTTLRSSVRNMCVRLLGKKGPGSCCEESESSPSYGYGAGPKFRAGPGQELGIRVLLALLYGISITWGYFLMLICMTYQATLFMAVIAGLVCGHFVFRWDAAVGEREDPCCDDGL
eukprot:Rmarinus@m.18288